MMTSMHIVVPGEFPTLTEIISAAKNHHMKYSSMKQEFTERTRVYVLKHLAGVKISVNKATIHLHWIRRTKRADPDNIRAGSKFVLDGLVKSRLLADDGQGNIDCLSDSFGVDRKYPRVEITMKWGK